MFDNFTHNLQSAVELILKNKKQINVLEAGCGSVTRELQFKENAYLVGIDISEDQLERNKLLHEKILGNLETYNFGKKSFDVIVCRYVLEHLSGPRNALKNLFKATKSGGIIIISVPNFYSLKGLVTKFTPQCFHVFIYKYIYEVKNAGKGGNPPFKNYMRPSIAPQKLMKFAEKMEFTIPYYWYLGGFGDWAAHHWQKKSKLMYKALLFSEKMLRVISFGKIRESEFIVILQKR